jgi:hypothetical protein
MPTRVSVQLKREEGSWTVNGYKEVDGVDIGEDNSSTNSPMNYDELSLSSDISDYADFLECEVLTNTNNHGLEVEGVVTKSRVSKPLSDVTNHASVTHRSKRKKITKTRVARKPTTSKELVVDKQIKKKRIEKDEVLMVKNPTSIGDMVQKPKTKKVKKTSKSTNTRARLPGITFDDWLSFGDGGNYSLSADDWSHVRGWTTIANKNKDFAAEAITFHRLVVKMKCDLGLQSARDCWSKVLPDTNESNYPLCVLVLMLCTPMVPDTKIIDVFGPFFKDNRVDEDWIIKEGEKGIAVRLRPLDAKTIVQNTWSKLRSE